MKDSFPKPIANQINLSLKWKLSLALIGVSMGLVLLYVFLAKQTFESDKIAYVFETRQEQLAGLSSSLLRKLEGSLAEAHSILLGFDTTSNKLNPMAQNVFDSQKTLLAIEVSQPGLENKILQIAKIPEDQARLAELKDLPAGQAFFAVGIDSAKFLVAGKESDQSGTIIKAIVEIPDVLANKDNRGSLMLIENEKILSTTRPVKIPDELIKELSKDRMAMTMSRRINGENYLITAAPVEGTNLKLISFYPEAVALSAIGLLYRRSLIFIAFTVFLTVLISLALSSGLTYKLNSLTAIAGEIARGNFSQKINATSRDEVGILQLAFLRMSEEIQKLLLETKIKARMEEELKTARLVQDLLFPLRATFETEGFKLSGYYATSTECGGDWWYYFQKNDDLVVVIADATGHGTPAALSTAAARSIFANLEEEANLNLIDIAKAWDRSIAASSGQKVFMTAFLVKINIKSGLGTCINASHEMPIVFKSGQEPRYIIVPPCRALGGVSQSWTETPFFLEKGERLFLFTDGLWAVENPSKKPLNERRFSKKLAAISEIQTHSEDFIKSAVELLLAHRQGAPLPDDVTMVVIDRLSA